MFGLDTVVVANVVLAALLAVFAGHWLAEKLFARNARRAAARTIGVSLATLGFPEKVTDPFFAYSDGDYPEFWGHVKRIVKLFTGDPKHVNDVLSEVVTEMAKDADGLKLLQDAIAAASAVKAAAAAPAAA